MLGNIAKKVIEKQLEMDVITLMPQELLPGVHGNDGSLP